MNIKVVENFLSVEECNRIINKSIDINSWDKTDDEYWDNRVFNAMSLPQDNIFRRNLYGILKKKRQTISDHYKIPQLFNAGFAIVRWLPGMKQEPHTDDMKEFLGDTETNVNRHREFGSIIYLNDNFTGGETYYPLNNFSVKPQTGKFIVHPGDSDHLHGVSEVKDNIRYTIASFWTTSKEHSNE